MKKTAYLVAAATCLLAASCTMNKLDESSTTLELRRDAAGTPVTISVTRGPQWTHVMQAGPFKFNILPQFVIWTQRADGSLIETLYITGALGGEMRHAGKEKLGKDFWKQCFPAWSRRAHDAGQKLPDTEDPYTDAVTSATPHSSFTIRSSLPAFGQPVDLYVEVNKSADHNKAFTEEKTDWIGQPSIVYAVTIPEVERNQEYALKAVGYGDSAASAQINRDFGALDTALHIVREIKVAFQAKTVE